jgi:hypothetical protein
MRWPEKPDTHIRGEGGQGMPYLYRIEKSLLTSLY